MSERHGNGPDDVRPNHARVCTESPLVDLGHGVRAQVRYIDGHPEGVYYEHTCCGHPESPGWCPVKPANADGWTLVSVDPLTLSPSLLCRACGHHGFVRDGRWVPA